MQGVVVHELDDVIQFIIDALSANAASGQGSVVSIRVTPYTKKGRPVAKEAQRIITPDDILDAHEALEQFDGDFKKLFGSRK